MLFTNKTAFACIIGAFILLCSCSTPGGAKHDVAYESEAAEYSDSRSKISGSPDYTSANNRMVAYSASLTLLVKDLDVARKTITEEVKNYNGFTATESTNYIRARIPAQNLDAFCAKIKTLGTVQDEQKSGNDITDQYRDDVIRLESLKAVRDRYTALLAKAKDVTEMLGVERELERINSSIEMLEGRKKYAESSVTYSNVSISLNDKETKPGPLGWVFYGMYRAVKWLFVWD